MKRYLYASYEQGFVYEDRDRTLLGKERVRSSVGIFLSRLDYDIHVMDMNDCGSKDIHRNVAQKIGGLYPGPLDQVWFDYAFTKGKTICRIIIFIIRKDILTAYERACMGKPFVSHVLVLLDNRIREGIFIFITPRWRETIAFERSVVCRCLISRRSGNVREDLSDALEGFNPKDIPIRIYAPDEEQAVLSDSLSALGFSHGIEIQSLESLPLSMKQRKTNLFKKENPFVKKIRMIGRILLVCASLAFLVLPAIGWNHCIPSAQLANRQNTDRPISETASGHIEEEITRMEQTLRELIQSDRPHITEFLNELSACLADNASLISLAVQESSFRIEALGKNPLGTLSDLKRLPCFSSVKMDQCIPVKERNAERFSVSGIFTTVPLYTAEEIIIHTDEDLLVYRDRLAACIDAVKKHNLGGGSPDIYRSGTSIRTMLVESKADISRYHITEGTGDAFIEFVLSIRMASFLDFLNTLYERERPLSIPYLSLKHREDGDIFEIVVRIGYETVQDSAR